MELTQRPQFKIATRSLPKPLLKSLIHIFSRNLHNGVMLVGGTALSGFYASHRRSDDIDLFTKSRDYQQATILAVKSLTEIGFKITDEFKTVDYYKVTGSLNDHFFTIDVVLDPNIHQVGNSYIIDNNLSVAGLQTILMCKSATLVSRCSEKDLYDLFWIIKNIPNIDYQTLIDLGNKIDGGVNAQAIILSISSTKLGKDACAFSLDNRSADEIYAELVSFQKELIKNLALFLNQQKPSELSLVVKKISKLIT